MDFNQKNNYERKFQDMQKYIPSLEKTINRLKENPDKVRQVQLTNLQTLHSILTNPKRQLKIEILEKSEKVLQKLCLLEKNGPSFNNEDTSSGYLGSSSESDLQLTVARAKLIQACNLPPPDSPSPPPQSIPEPRTTPILIPTERKFEFSSNSAFNDYNSSKSQNRYDWKQATSSSFGDSKCFNKQNNENEVLFERRTVPRSTISVPYNNKYYEERSNITDSKFKSQNIENKKAQGDKLLLKPPLSNDDLKSLLESDEIIEEGEISNKSNDSDIEKLESLRQQLKSEIERLPETSKIFKTSSKDTQKNKSSLPSSKHNCKKESNDSTATSTRVIKESNNLFGNILNSIDDQIIGSSKQKDIKKIDKNSPKIEKNKNDVDKQKNENKESDETNKIEGKVKTSDLKKDSENRKKIIKNDSSKKTLGDSKIVQRKTEVIDKNKSEHKSHTTEDNKKSKYDKSEDKTKIKISEFSKNKHNASEIKSIDNITKTDISREEKKTSENNVDKKDKSKKDIPKSSDENITKQKEKSKANLKNENHSSNDKPNKKIEDNIHKEHIKKIDVKNEMSNEKRNTKISSETKEDTKNNTKNSCDKTRNDEIKIDLSSKDSKQIKMSNPDKPVRLADKYNPHPRKNSISNKSDEDGPDLNVTGRGLTAKEMERFYQDSDTNENSITETSSNLKSNQQSTCTRNWSQSDANALFERHPKTQITGNNSYRGEIWQRCGNNPGHQFDKDQFSSGLTPGALSFPGNITPRPNECKGSSFSGGLLPTPILGNMTPKDSFAINNTSGLITIHPFGGNITPKEHFASDNPGRMTPRHAFGGNVTPKDPFASDSSGRMTPRHAFGGNMTPKDPFASDNSGRMAPRHAFGGNMTPKDPFASDNSGRMTPRHAFGGNMTPKDPFVTDNSGNMTPRHAFGGNMTPKDPFASDNSGRMTPRHAFGGNMTPKDPFASDNSGRMTPRHAFGGNMTPKDPFVTDNPGRMTPRHSFGGNMTPIDPFASNNSGGMTPRHTFGGNMSPKDNFSEEIHFSDKSGNRSRIPSNHFPGNMTPRDSFGMQDDNAFKLKPPVYAYPIGMPPQNSFTKFSHSKRGFSDSGMASHGILSRDQFPNQQEFFSQINFSNRQQNPNPYDLSQIGPIDYYDNNRGLKEQGMFQLPHYNNPNVLLSPPHTSQGLLELPMSGGSKLRQAPMSYGDYKKVHGRVNREERSISKTISPRDPRRTSIESKKPEDNKFRGYDPRPKPRTEKIGKLESYKIPKVKKEDDIDSTVDETKNIVSSNKDCGEEAVIKIDADLTQNPEITSNSQEIIEDNKVFEGDKETKENKNINEKEDKSIGEEIKNEQMVEVKKDESKEATKEDIINEFIQKLCESGETDKFIEVIEKLGLSLSKQKQMKTPVIESDSEEDEDKGKSKEKSYETVNNDKNNSENSQDEVEKKEEKVVLTKVSKCKKRSTKKSEIPKIDEESNTTVKPKMTRKRRNPLEMLQGDLRDIFVGKGGFLTDTGQRMCRIIKENQTKTTDVPSTAPSETVTKKDDKITKSKKSINLKVRSPRKSPTKLPDSPQKRSKIPRVVLEKTDLVKLKESVKTETVPDNELKYRNSKNVQPENETIFDNVVPGSKALIFAKRNIRCKKAVVRLTRLKELNKSPKKIETIIDKLHQSSSDEAFSEAMSNFSSFKSIQDFNQSSTTSSPLKQKSLDTDYSFHTSDDDEYPIQSLKQTRLCFKNKKNSIKGTKLVPVKKKKKNIWATGKRRSRKIKNKKISKNLDFSKSSEDIDIDQSINKDESDNEQQEVLDDTSKKTNENKTDTVDKNKLVESGDSIKVAVDLNLHEKDYAIGVKQKTNCKICSWSGKNVVYHYKTAHPDSEVIISRLNEQLASICIQQSIEQVYSNYNEKEEMFGKDGRKRRFSGFFCRFCDILLKNTQTEGFLDHLTKHTGEYRYGCTKCNFEIAMKKSHRRHMQVIHPEEKNFQAIRIVYPTCRNTPILFGYICSYCNYTQLYKENIEKHIAKYHQNEQVTIYKINMSSISNEVLKNEKVDVKGKMEVNSSQEEKIESEENKISENIVEEKEIFEKIVEEKETSEKTVEEKETSEKIVEEKETSEKIVEEKETSEKTVEEKETSEKTVEEKELFKKTLEEKDISEKTVEQEEISEKTVEEKKIVERKETIEKTVGKEDHIIEKEDDMKLNTPKEPDMKVFLCKEMVLDEEKIQDERLKKMQEISQKLVSPRRNYLNFVDKLKSKLESVNQEDDSEEAEKSVSVNEPADKIVILNENAPIMSSNNDLIVDLPIPNLEQVTTEIENNTMTDIANEMPNLENEIVNMKVTSKSNTSMIETIQRLANICKQNSNIPSTETESSTNESLSSNIILQKSNDTPELTANVLDIPLDISSSLVNQDNFTLNVNSIYHLNEVPELVTDINSSHKTLDNDISFPDDSTISIFKIDQISVCITDRGVSLQCFICKFVCGNQQIFSEHCETYHSGDTWNGYCNYCGLIVYSLKKVYVKDAFNHIITKHLPLVYKQPAQELPKKPMIRMRRLSGDKLSEFNTTSTPKDPVTPLPIFTEDTFQILEVCSLSEQVKKPDPVSELRIENVVSLKETEVNKDLNTQKKNTTLSSASSPKKQSQQLIYDHALCLKSPSKLQALLMPKKLVKLYKCMSSKCSFATDNDKIFLCHLNTTHINETDYLTCPYCLGKNYTDTEVLISHITEKHGRCRYQCGYCFFRAGSGIFVQQHCLKIHKRVPKLYAIKQKLDDQIKYQDICQPYYCEFHNKCFYIPEQFKIHLSTHIDEPIKCHKCLSVHADANTLIRHYSKHKINKFQCLYCLYGSFHEKLLRNHMFTTHPNRPPKVLVRNINTSICKTKVILSKLEHIRLMVTLDLDITMKNLNKYVVKETPVNVEDDQEDKDSTENSNTPPPVEIIDLSDEDVVIEQNSNVNEGTSSNNLNDSLGSDEPLVLLRHRNAEKNTEIENAIDPLSIDEQNPVGIDNNEMPVLESFEINAESTENSTAEKVIVINANQETHNLDGEPEKCNNDVSSLDDIKHTGLTGSDLYRCGKEGCDYKADYLSAFKDHLLICDALTFHCFHCRKQVKFVYSLLDHIKTHGTFRFGCSLCLYRAPIHSHVTKHLKMKHKINATKIIPLNPLKSNQEIDLFVVCPQGKNIPQPKRKNSHKDSNTSLESNTELKTVFDSSEVFLLPLQPIFQQEIKCAHCSYSTKVRTNMIRHLQAHSNSVSVPESAPVNPVPCLDKNEKMFDKMTNLSLSSMVSETSRMGVKISIGDKSGKDKLVEDNSKIPVFVPERERYVCGAEGCRYLTINETLFRYHFKALHSSELFYKCPHCLEALQEPQGPPSIEKICSHLKMHDQRLYKCVHCQYYHYQRHVVERHLSNKHADNSLFVQVVREITETNETKTDESTVETELKEIKPWRCGLCKFRTLTKNDIIEHASINHGIKSQYKCSLCQFKCAYDKNFEGHFESKHPGQKVDMISVYYKEEIQTETTDVDNFDTTPIWRRDMPRVRHIRGILFEDMKTSPKKNKSDGGEKLVRKLSETDEDKSVLERVKRPRRSAISLVDMAETDEIVDVETIELKSEKQSPKVNDMYSCPYCDKFKSRSDKDLADHLFKELRCDRFVCTQCKIMSHSYNLLKKHVENIHNKSPNQTIVAVTPDKKVEQKVIEIINEQRVHVEQSDKTITSLTDINELYEASILETKSVVKQLRFDVPNASNILEEAKAIASITGEIPEIEINEPSTSEVKELNVEEMEPIKKIFPCPHCDFTAHYRVMMNNHKRKHYNIIPFKCGRCAFTGCTSEEVMRHNQYMHGKQQPIVEQVCDLADVQILHVPMPLKRKTSSTKNEIPQKRRRKSDDATIQKEDEDEAGLIIRCKYCIREDSTLVGMYNHWFEGHRIASDPLKKPFAYQVNSDDSRGRLICELCGYRGTKKTSRKHHNARHPGLPLQIRMIPYTVKPNMKIHCYECDFYAYSVNIIRSHVETLHPEVNFNEIYKVEIDIEYHKEQIKRKKMTKPPQILEITYLCDWCPEIFTDKKHFNLHTSTAHFTILNNELDGVVNDIITKVDQYICSGCYFRSEKYSVVLTHVRSHSKPLKCTVCSLTFMTTNQISHHCQKVHDQTKPIYKVGFTSSQAINYLKTKISCILKDGTKVKYIDLLKELNKTKPNQAKYDSMFTVSEPFNDDSDNSLLPSQNPCSTVKNYARKSTTQTNTSFHPIKPQVAEKSTCSIPKADPAPSQGFSYYGQKPTIDTSNIISTMYFGGIEMKVNIPTLNKLTNIFPKLVLKDLKKQLGGNI